MEPAAHADSDKSTNRGRQESKQPRFRPEITIDSAAGMIRVEDPRLFHAGQRAFCQRLVDSALARPEVQKIAVDLATATCRFDFRPPGATPHAMAEHLSHAVNGASATSTNATSSGSRSRRCAWTTLTGYQGTGGTTIWETVAIEPDRLQFRSRLPRGDVGRRERLAEVLSSRYGIEACRITRWSRELVLEVHTSLPGAEGIMDEVDRALRETRSRRTPLALWSDPGQDQHVHGAEGWDLRRLRNLAFAVGSMALTLVGLLVPGIPTVPFLLATSYYLARSSPWLDEKLRRTSILGPILTEWEETGGLSRKSKATLIGLTGTVLLITIIVTPLSPIAVSLIILLWFLSLYGISRIASPIPQSHEEPGTGRTEGSPLLVF